MPLTRVQVVGLTDNSITASKIANGTVVAAEIADGAITSSKIADSAVVTVDIADANVTSAKLASNLNLSGVVTYTGAANEKANVITSNITANVSFNPYEQPIVFWTANSNANTTVTVNFTGLSTLTQGNTLSAVVMFVNNATYNAFISAVQVDGSAAAAGGVGATTGNVLRWQGGFPYSGNANVEVYSFSIFKTAASSYAVLGAKSNFQ